MAEMRSVDGAEGVGEVVMMRVTRSQAVAVAAAEVGEVSPTSSETRWSLSLGAILTQGKNIYQINQLRAKGNQECSASV